MFCAVKAQRRVMELCLAYIMLLCFTDGTARPWGGLSENEIRSHALLRIHCAQSSQRFKKVFSIPVTTYTSRSF